METKYIIVMIDTGGGVVVKFEIRSLDNCPRVREIVVVSGVPYTVDRVIHTPGEIPSTRIEVRK